MNHEGNGSPQLFRELLSFAIWKSSGSGESPAYADPNDRAQARKVRGGLWWNKLPAGNAAAEIRAQCRATWLYEDPKELHLFLHQNGQAQLRSDARACQTATRVPTEHRPPRRIPSARD